MGQDNYKFRYEAYKNNTFDLNIVEKSLDESKMSGYQYLRQFQLDSTGYKRFDFEMQEIYRTYNVNHDIVLVPRKWMFFVDHEFINVGNRLAYKRSNLYEKDLSFNEIVNRPDLFDSTFMVFINGKLFTKGVEILCKEDKTYVIFLCKEKPSPEGFSIEEMREYIENNAKVSIYFVPNTGIKSISTNAYRVRTLNNGDGIPARTLGLTDHVDYNNSLAYINPVNSIESIPTTTTLTETGLYVNEESINNMIRSNPNNTAMNIQLFPLRNLLSRIEVEGTKWFEIPMQDYPVAVENCLIVDEDGLFVHDAKIKHYYPNIYSIENVDELINSKKLYIYVFYFENKVDKLKHLDMLYTYHKYVPDYLKRYENGTINEIVKNFDPNIVDYRINNYRKGLPCNEGINEIFIRSSDKNIYRISNDNGDIKYELYDGNDKNYPPINYYVLDEAINRRYKIYMVDDKVHIEPLMNNDKKDIVYIYDNTNNSPEAKNAIIELFEYLQYEDHFKYKILKMREFIKADVNNFRRYLRNLGLGNNYYYVDVSKIDLTTRKRTDNKDSKLKRKIFDKEMYMFVFRNDFRGMYDDLIIHVDGIRYDREIQVYKTDMLDYVYVPCELVKPDSILEIEKVSDTNRDVLFKSHNKSNIIKLDIGEVAVRNKTLFNDLFIVDRETGKYLDPSDYQIILPVKFHMDDIESDIVLDYIITETDNGYFQLAVLNHGLIEIYKDDDVDDPENAFYLSLQSDKHEFFQFDMNSNKALFNKVDYVNGYVINKIRAMDDKNLIYQFKMVDGAIKIEISEDDGTGKQLAEGGLNIVNIEDVFLQCPREIKVKITNPDFLDKNLALHIKKNHNIMYTDDILDEDDGEGIEASFNPILFKATAKKDPRYFRVYQNGRLIPRHLGVVNFPDFTLDADIRLFPGFVRDFSVDYNISVECMPYMMKQVCYLKTIPRDKVIDLQGLIDKPFDLRWYDIYLNGRKLVKNEIEIITANKIKILKSNSLKNLEIIENSRDKEYFGAFDEGVIDILDLIFEIDKEFADNVNDSIINNENLKDTEDDIVRIPISSLEFILREYYNYLVATLGMINPDLLQITREDVRRFDPLIDPDRPFPLGFDIYGSNRLDEVRLTLPINPDE